MCFARWPCAWAMVGAVALTESAAARDTWPRARLITTIEGLRELELMFTQAGQLRWVARADGAGADTLYGLTARSPGPAAHAPLSSMVLCTLPGRASVTLDQRSLVVRRGSLVTMIDPSDCRTRESIDFGAHVLDVDYSEASDTLAVLVRRNSLGLELRNKDRWWVWPSVSAPLEIGVTPTGEVLNLDTSHASARLWQAGEPAPQTLALPAKTSLFFAPDASVLFAGRLGEVHRFDWPLKPEALGTRIPLPPGAALRAAVDRGRFLVLDTREGLATFDTTNGVTRQVARGQPEAVAVSPSGDVLAFVIRDGRQAKLFGIWATASPLFVDSTVQATGAQKPD